MTGPFIPAGIETRVLWGQSEFASAGLSVDTGPSSGLVASTAGMYRFSAQLPFNAYAGAAAFFVGDDNTTDVGVGGEVAPTWDEAGNFDNANFDYPAALPTPLFLGDVEITVSLGLTGGAAGESVAVWVQQNGTDLAPRAYVDFNANGDGSANLSFITNCGPGDVFEVICEIQGAPAAGPITPVPAFSQFTVQRLSPVITYAQAFAVSPTGDVDVYPFSFDRREGLVTTLILHGIVPLSAGGSVLVVIYTGISSGFYVDDTGHAEMNYLGPLLERQVCSGGGGE